MLARSSCRLFGHASCSVDHGLQSTHSTREWPAKEELRAVVSQVLRLSCDRCQGFYREPLSYSEPPCTFSHALQLLHQQGSLPAHLMTACRGRCCERPGWRSEAKDAVSRGEMIILIAQGWAHTTHGASTAQGRVPVHWIGTPTTHLLITNPHNKPTHAPRSSPSPPAVGSYQPPPLAHLLRRTRPVFPEPPRAAPPDAEAEARRARLRAEYEERQYQAMVAGAWLRGEW